MDVDLDSVMCSTVRLLAVNVDKSLRWKKLKTTNGKSDTGLIVTSEN